MCEVLEHAVGSFCSEEPRQVRSVISRIAISRSPHFSAFSCKCPVMFICQSVWIKPGGKCKIVFQVTALSWFDTKKEQFHRVPCLVNSCIHTSDISSQSVALVVDPVQPCFVIESSAFALRCSCLDISFAFLFVCYVQLQCTFSTVCVCVCVRVCMYVYIYVYIYIYTRIYMYIYILFICQSWICNLFSKCC